MGACAINGNWYSAEIRRPLAFATSPAEYNVAAFLEADCLRDSITAAVFKSLLGPSSQLTFNKRRPSIALQTLSATTATAASLILPAKVTPEIFFDSLSSKLVSLPPIVGHRDSTAYFIPGNRKSMPNTASPFTFEGVSTRGKRCPTIL